MRHESAEGSIAFSGELGLRQGPRWPCPGVALKSGDGGPLVLLTLLTQWQTRALVKSSSKQLLESLASPVRSQAASVRRGTPF